MEPTIREGDFVLLCRGFSVRKGDAVIAQMGGMLTLKRVKEAREGVYWLEGDNAKESRDSREYGWVRSEHVLGRARVFHRPDWLTSGILK